MELTCQLLLYLDRRRYLTSMKNSCKQFLEENYAEKTMNKFAPLRFLLDFDVMDALDAFPELGDFLLKEPIKWQKMCKDILYACLESLHNCDQIVQASQVSVIPRLRCVPKGLIRSNDCFYSGLATFEGILIAISKPISYVCHSVWSCPEECEGNEIILHYIPKVPPKCYVCKSVLFENSGLRRCGDQVTATFQLKDKLLSKDFCIVDDLIEKLVLGSKFDLHAVIMNKLIFVWSLEEVLLLPAPMTCPVPKDVEELYQACGGMPWKFVYCLASSIGVSICPLNCFMHLKMSLLLSLASVKANMINNSSIIHVLIVGYDTRYVSELMLTAGKLADTSVNLGMSGSVSTSLMASSGGVFIMSLPLYAYNQKKISSVLSAMETGEVVTETNKTKLRTAIWAQGMDIKKTVLYNIASVFGNVCRGDYGEFTDEIVEFVLEQAVGPAQKTNEEIKALKDVALYIDLVAGINVVLDKLAENLLTNYFLAARRERPRAVSMGSIGTLVATCVTSARLCRRTVAGIEDAVFAIWLHVCSCPEPRFAPEEYLQTPADIKKLQKIINNFQGWLEQFTGTCVS